MGTQSLVSMIEAANYQQALAWHLSANMYPPIDAVFIPIAEQAIDHANENEWDHLITLPNGITLSVETIVSELHLEWFIYNGM